MAVSCAWYAVKMSKRNGAFGTRGRWFLSLPKGLVPLWDKGTVVPEPIEGLVPFSKRADGILGQFGEARHQIVVLAPLLLCPKPAWRRIRRVRVRETHAADELIL